MLRIFNRLLLLLVFLSCPGAGLGQETAEKGRTSQALQFKRITQADGLSNDFVLCLFQDSEGFLWFGTENGLNRYDGYRFTVFKEDPQRAGSIRGNFIETIFEDSQQNLWVSTDKGVNLFDRQSGNFNLLAAGPSAESVKNFPVDDIAEGQKGDIWLASRTLVRMTLGTDNNWQAETVFTPPELPGAAINRVTKIIADTTSGFLWAATLNSIHRINLVDQQIEAFVPTTPIPLSGDYDGNIKSMSLDKEGRVVVATHESGIYRIEGPNSSPFTSQYKVVFNEGRLSENLIEDLEIPAGTESWLATTKGLYKVDLDRGELLSFQQEPLKRYRLANEQISDLLVDKEQNLWVATYGGGVHFLANLPHPFEHHSLLGDDPSELLSNQVRSLLFTGSDELWVATLGEGLNRFRIDADEWKKEKSWRIANTGIGQLPIDQIIKIIRARSGYIWIAPFKGPPIRFDPRTGEMVALTELLATPQPIGGVWSLAEDGEGNIWVGTRESGLFRFSPTTQELRKFTQVGAPTVSLDNNHVYKIIVGRDGKVWVGHGKGLSQYDPAADSWQHLQHTLKDDMPLSDSWVWTMHEDSQGAIWIGTNQGLNRYDPHSGSVQQFYEKDGLPSNVIWGIIEDDQQKIWVTTDMGLARSITTTASAKKHPEDISFVSYTDKSGLGNTTFLSHAYYLDSLTGHLYFGGLNGIDVVHPELIIAGDTSTVLRLSDLTIGRNQKETGDLLDHPFISESSLIELSHRDDLITLSCTDFNYLGRENNQYEYQLRGLSEQWVPLGEDKRMTFINLQDGPYTLNMKGVTPDGLAIPSREIVRLMVVPPWWRSLPAYGSYLLLAIGLIYWGYRHQVSRLLYEKESRRLKEIDALKSRLYTNITHEFRTPLTVISGLISQLKGQDNIKEPIQHNSNQLLSLVNQMLDLRKLESGGMPLHFAQADIVRYVRYLTESFSSYAESTGVRIHFLTDLEELIMDFDRDKIARIVSNLLSNAVKFTPVGGNIYVRLEQKVDMFYLEVRDTGKGIPAKELSRIFNRFYQVDDSATRLGEGTGIGLTLTKELVTVLNGEISVSSVENKGSSFHLLLPITNEAPAEKEVVPQEHFFIPKKARIKNWPEFAPLAENTIDASSDKPVVLIIEDNTDVIHYLVECLNAHYQLRIATDGEAGIKEAIEEVPDIIVSDVMMPIKDGFEVCQTLKTDERTDHIPIILLTAKADLEARLIGLEHGADVYLSKPFHQDELLINLRNLLDTRKKLQLRFAEIIIEAPALAPAGIESPTLNTPQEDPFLQKIRRFVEKDLADADIGMPQLVRELSMSRSQVYKKVKALTGKSPSRYVRSIRLAHARELLKTSDMNVSEVGYAVGFTSPVYFSKVYFEEFGLRPNVSRQ